MDSIGDAQGFSGKTPITPSRGFSVETLTGVTLSWKTKLNRSISAMEYLDGCTTTIRCVAKKIAAVEGGLVCFGDDFSTVMLFLNRWTCI